MDIRINIGSTEFHNWIKADIHHIEAFKNFKNIENIHHYRYHYNYIYNGDLFTISRLKNNKNNGIYLFLHEKYEPKIEYTDSDMAGLFIPTINKYKHFYPICDWNDVMKISNSKLNKCSYIETEAYFDFIYSDYKFKDYKYNDDIFSMNRKEDDTIYIRYIDDKNESFISDNNEFRSRIFESN